MRLLRFRRHPVSEEDLSVYLDGRLPARDKERVDAHLQSCADCSRKLEEMQSLVAEMRRLPQATAPRSFAISPELAAATRREADRVAAGREGTAARRVYLGLSGATVAAAVLLVAVVGVDLLRVQRRRPGLVHRDRRHQPPGRGERGDGPGRRGNRRREREPGAGRRPAPSQRRLRRQQVPVGGC